MSKVLKTKLIFDNYDFSSLSGKFVEVKEEYEEFEYFAEDCVTVRAPGKEFYLCRILDDVPESSNEEINVAWFDQIGANRYKVRVDWKRGPCISSTFLAK